MKKYLLITFCLLTTALHSQQPTSFDFQEKYKVTDGAKSEQGVYNSINKYVVVETGMSEMEM